MLSCCCCCCPGAIQKECLPTTIVLGTTKLSHIFCRLKLKPTADVPPQLSSSSPEGQPGPSKFYSGVPKFISGRGLLWSTRGTPCLCDHFKPVKSTPCQACRPWVGQAHFVGVLRPAKVRLTFVVVSTCQNQNTPRLLHRHIWPRRSGIASALPKDSKTQKISKESRAALK